MWQALALCCRQSGLAVPLTASPGHERAVPCDRELEARDGDSAARQGPTEQGNYKILSWPCPTEFWSNRHVPAGHCDCRLSFRLKFSCLRLLCAMMMGVYYHTQPEFVIQLRRI